MSSVVRVSVEITVEQKSRLLAMAARRGDADISRLVQDALDLWFVSAHAPEERRDALALRGSLRGPEGEALEAAVRRIRNAW